MSGDILVPELIDTDVRRTPRWLIGELSLEWDFGLDVCADKDNRIVENYLGLDHPDPARRDGLTADWGLCLGIDPRQVCWMNPPYSAGQLRLWCAKATAMAT